MQFIINWFTLIAFVSLFSTVFILQPIVPKQTTLDNAVYHHKLGPGNFTPIWTWIYPAARSSIVFEWKTSCFQMNLQSVYYRSLTVRKSEGSDIARENIGGERFCAYHFASSALCGIYFWHFMHILDSLKFMEKSPLFFSTVGWICFGIWYKFFNCRIWRCWLSILYNIIVKLSPMERQSISSY